MIRAVLFDLFETLITESNTRPAGVSSLAPALGCEREPFRRHWKALRPAVTAGAVSFRRALGDIATSLGGQADEATLQRLSDERARIKAEPYARIEHQVLTMIDDLRRRDLRLAVISNCFAEDVTVWPHCSLASRFDCALFSCEVGVAKPNPEIYLEAARRLRIDVSEACYVGDGADEELSGAERAGLRAFKARWFLRRWPHFREEPSAFTSVDTVAAVVTLVDQIG
jgi:putative hydrolase of the HAD superfamily